MMDTLKGFLFSITIIILSDSWQYPITQFFMSFSSISPNIFLSACIYNHGEIVIVCPPRFIKIFTFKMFIDCFIFPNWSYCFIVLILWIISCFIRKVSLWRPGYTCCSCLPLSVKESVPWSFVSSRLMMLMYTSITEQGVNSNSLNPLNVISFHDFIVEPWVFLELIVGWLPVAFFTVIYWDSQSN